MKKTKYLPFFVAVLNCLIFSLTSCKTNDNIKEKVTNSSNITNTTETKDILIAYFSCTNNTKNVAQCIKDITNGNLFEIIPTNPYLEQDLNYNDSNSRSSLEQKDDNARPEISNKVDNFEDYEIIYLGYPIWHGQAPKIIYTFLESYDFSNKTIAPFCTSASSPLGSSVDNLHNSASNANWVDGKRFSSSFSPSEVENWINNLNI